MFVNEDGEVSNSMDGVTTKGVTRMLSGHPLNDMPAASEDVKVTYHFPDHQNEHLPIGGDVTILCGFENEGEEALTVTAIMGSLNSPFDFDFHLQNYSYKKVDTEVQPGEEITFDYEFKLHHTLDAVEYVVAVTVFYEDDDESFASTFFNSTVTLEEVPEPFDAQSFFSFVLTFVLLVGGGFFAWSFVFGNGKKSSSRRSVERGTAAKADSDWSSSFDAHAKNVAGKRKSSGKGKKKN